MDLHFVDDGKLSYYVSGSDRVSEDDYSLLGFKDNMAVVKPHSAAPKLKNKIKILRKLPSSINLTNLLTDEAGDKFINLNGQKLKVVPQDRIPEEVRKRTLILKQQMVNTGNNLKKPLPIRVIRSTTQVNNADALQLVKPLSADKFLTTHKDKPINIHSLKKIKLITTKLQQSAFSVQGIHTESSLHSACSVNPTITSAGIRSQSSRCEEQIKSATDPDCLLPVAYRQEKLLSEKNIQILNKVKMHALNLSMKKIEDASVEKGKKRVVMEVGIQTDQCNTNKVFADQMVQTDVQPHYDLLEMDLDSFLGITMDSPIMSDIFLSSNYNVGKSPIAENTGKNIQVNRSESSSNMGHSVSGNAVNDDTMKKRLLFFQDLRECLSYNASGNLPIHEGVTNNNVGIVKRHCIALKARKAGVNLENHNGWIPLQLAIIHEAHVDIVQTLLDTEADIREPDGDGNNILHLAAKFERHKVLEVILFHKSFRVYFDCINSFNFEGLTPLMICCISSWTAGAHLIIKHGADVNLRDQTSGRTALFHAAEAQNDEIVRILLNHKADPKIKNFFGTSPHDAMYELEDMSDTIKSLIFGRSKKRTIEAEMNPVRTAKAAKSLKTFSRLQKIEHKDGVPIATPPIRYKMQRQIK